MLGQPTADRQASLHLKGGGPPARWQVSREGSLVAATASSLLSADATGLASSEDGGGAGLDVLLGGDAHHEGGDVDHLLADGDVLLVDEDARVVDGVGQVALLDEGLEATLKEL